MFPNNLYNWEGIHLQHHRRDETKACRVISSIFTWLMTSILLISLRIDTFGKKGISFLRNRIFCAITLLRRESCRIVDRLGREGYNFCETTKAFRVISGIFQRLSGGLLILPKYLGHTMTMYVYLVQTVESMLDQFLWYRRIPRKTIPRCIVF